MGRWGDGEIGGWGDWGMGREFLTTFYSLLTPHYSLCPMSPSGISQGETLR
ncbi:MAG: hypothetical protein WBA39_00620 [Rivularia sp. (in: cyanobacteria)]